MRTIAALGVVALSVGAGVIGADGRAEATVSGPAAPVEVTATNGFSSISLSWVQPATGSRATSFRVYEGTVVVARNTTTHVTVNGLGFSSTHTYTVTAVDSVGRESSASASVTRRVLVGGAAPSCQSAVPTGLTVTAITASAVSLVWAPGSPAAPTGAVQVLDGTTMVTQSLARGARVGGLAPSSTHVFRLRVFCFGQFFVGPSVTVTTAAGLPARPAAPVGVSVTATGTDAISLSWLRAGGAVAAVRYVVYEGAVAVASTASTSVTVPALYRDTTHLFTVIARDVADNESAASAPVQASTVTCEQLPPRPARIAATVASTSTVTLAWTQDSAADLYTVFEGDVAVATSATPSAVVSGLAASSAHAFTVSATLVSGCGETARAAAPTVTTPAGPPGRPAAPTSLAAQPGPPGFATASVTLRWSQPASTDPAVGYRLYEGATVVASSPTTTVTLTLPTAVSHRYTVSSVDAAGAESTQSQPVTFTVPFIPPP
jgi:hypothetical protein